ncbi:IS110 family transposase [Streptococcus pluranimalium]
MLIARKLRSDDTTQHHQIDEKMEELKELTRFQNQLIQARSKNKNLYVRLLDIVFPERHSVVGN